MIRYSSLVGVQLKNRLAGFTAVSGSDKRAARNRMLIMLVIALVALEFMFGYVYILTVFTRAAVEFGYPDIVLDLVVLAAMLAQTMFGIFSVLSNIFLVRDGELLCSLPISPRKIFMSKLGIVYITEVLISALFLLPATIVWAVIVGNVPYVVYFLKTLYLILLLPAAPICVAVLLDLPLMLIASKARRREAFVTIGSLIVFIAIFVLQNFLTSKLAEAGSGQGFFADLLKFGLHKLNSFILPPASWASNAIYGGKYQALLTLGMFTLLSLILGVLVYFIAGGLYRYALRSGLESRQKHKKAELSRIKTDAKSPIRAIVAKEWKVLLRSPVFAMNSLVSGLMVVLLCVIPFISGGQNAVFPFLASLKGSTRILGIIAACGLLSTLNTGAASVISRQGSAFWVIKSIPVSYKTQAKAYAVFAGTLVLTWALPVFACAFFIFKFGLWESLLGLAAGFVLGCAVSNICMVFDFYTPKLGWINEAEPIKQNFNAIKGALLGVAALAAAAAPIVVLYMLVSPWLATAAAVFISGLGLMLSLRFFVSSAAKALDRVEG